MKKLFLAFSLTITAISFMFAQNVPTSTLWGGTRIPIITAAGDTSGYTSLADLKSTYFPTSGGTVTSISVTSANGLAGTSNGSATAPALTLSTTVNGMVKANGTAFSAATAGTDYSAGTSALATGILKSTTSTGALSIAVAGTDYVTPSGNITGTAGGLSSTLAVSSGGTGATTFTAGYLKASGTTAFTTVATIPTTDLSGTISNAQLAGSIDLTTKVTGILPIANGGTGSSTQNFVDLSTTQASIGGAKTFSGALTSSGGFTSSGITTLSSNLITTVGAITGNTTLTTSSSLYQEVNATSAAVTVTLPTSPTDGTSFEIVKIAGTNNLTVTRGGANTVNGLVSHVIVSSGKLTTFKYKGGNWRVY